ncbi:MAG: serine/threonine-protein phosphatase [Actinomycetota bacterium]|nr:serine/threonine-protein phosphatase [Actinomycetota bacterium]
MGSEHHVAEALERALLPKNLPDVPGWSIATIYQPAGDHVLVGGDFYDWFAQPDGAYGLLVGDVAGKGQVAATVGMSIRKGLKALLWAIPDVSEAVAILEQALADDLSGTFASFCYLHLETGNRVRFLSAGHPRPWLLRGGEAKELCLSQNALFGTGLAETWELSEIDVVPDDLLLLFSDGLVEARLDDGRFFGEGPLQQMLTELSAGLRPWELALELAGRVEQPSVELRDDLVVTVLQYNG